MKTRPCRSVLFPLLALFAIAQNAVAAELRVRVDGLRSHDGAVRIALYGSEATFLDDALAGQESPADPNGTYVRFSGLSPGVVAVAAYHDENGNRKLDRGLFGVPVEGYGFANNAQGWFGPPSFEDASVAVSDVTVIRFKMVYP